MILFPANKTHVESLGLWTLLVAICSLFILWILSGAVFYFERVGVIIALLTIVLSVVAGWVVETKELPQAITNGIVVVWFLLIVLFGLVRMFLTLSLSGIVVWILLCLAFGYIIAYFDETHPIEDPSLDTN